MEVAWTSSLLGDYDMSTWSGTEDSRVQVPKRIKGWGAASRWVGEYVQLQTCHDLYSPQRYPSYGMREVLIVKACAAIKPSEGCASMNGSVCMEMGITATMKS